ncbi:hypothetical protein [Paraferrimonas sp. SM1919]|uniref:hypothetical protein n=1 Tax=Paraferrimonas sp. SM1919 TaxID=2662263 RepID=UPI0013D566E7|nr:hypothetical protein [Paraferrimonas sp. SM1919]
MTTEADKGKHELEIFHKFILGLQQTTATNIVKCLPPQPDIFCYFNRAPTFFELARVYNIEQVHDSLQQAQHKNIEDASMRVLRAKLSKKYQAVHPIHLLLYDDIGLAVSCSEMLKNIAGYLSLAENIPFTKVWYMSGDGSHAVTF